MNELNLSMQTLAHGMLREDIVKFGGPFTLKDGRKSVSYVNLRDMISLPGLFDGAVRAYAQTLGQNPKIGTKPDGTRRYLAGIPEAASYYAGAVAYELGWPLLQHRVKGKEHGQPRSVEGRFSEGDEVVLLDDVITGAKAKLEEVTALGEAGLKTTGVVVLVDREQGGRTELESKEIEFAAAMTLSGIARYALDENLGNVTQTLYDELLGELDPLVLRLALLAQGHSTRHNGLP